MYSNGDCVGLYTFAFWSALTIHQGTGPNFTQTLFQSLATAAGYDPAFGPGSSCTASSASGQCVLPWGSGTKPVTSVVLIANGIGFAIVTVILTMIGSTGDYGTCGRWILFVVTIVCWASQYACLALTCKSCFKILFATREAEWVAPSRWHIAMALYIISFVTYGASLVFFAAAFPRLARNTPYLRKLRGRYENGDISTEEYEREESLEKNRITNISTVSFLLCWLDWYYGLPGAQ